MLSHILLCWVSGSVHYVTLLNNFLVQALYLCIQSLTPLIELVLLGPEPQLQTICIPSSKEMDGSAGFSSLMPKNLLMSRLCNYVKIFFFPFCAQCQDHHANVQLLLVLPNFVLCVVERSTICLDHDVHQYPLILFRVCTTAKAFLKPQSLSLSQRKPRKKKTD